MTLRITRPGTAKAKRVFTADLGEFFGQEVLDRGSTRFIRNHKSTTFIILQDVSGTVQTVGPSKMPTHVKRDDALEIVGRVGQDARAPRGIEVDILHVQVVGESREVLPFSSASDLSEVGQE